MNMQNLSGYAPAHDASSLHVRVCALLQSHCLIQILRNDVIGEQTTTRHPVEAEVLPAKGRSDTMLAAVVVLTLLCFLFLVALIIVIVYFKR